jgi:hypothetical protein
MVMPASATPPDVGLVFSTLTVHLALKSPGEIRGPAQQQIINSKPQSRTDYPIMPAI